MTYRRITTTREALGLLAEHYAAETAYSVVWQRDWSGTPYWGVLVVTPGRQPHLVRVGPSGGLTTMLELDAREWHRLADAIRASVHP